MENELAKITAAHIRIAAELIEATAGEKPVAPNLQLPKGATTAQVVMALAQHLAELTATAAAPRGPMTLNAPGL